MKSVDIRYFALLKEQAKVNEEKIQVDCKTYEDLYRVLQDKHGFTLPLEMIQVAVNDEFSRLSNDIEDGARVVFIPPVAGG